MAAQFLVWKEDENQDKILENGAFVLLEDEEAVIQQLGTTLRLAKNDQFTDLDEGLRYVDDNERGILGANDLSLGNEAEIIKRINNSFGVNQLVSLTTEFVTPTSFRIEAVVTTIFSETPAIASVTLG